MFSDGDHGCVGIQIGVRLYISLLFRKMCADATLCAGRYFRISSHESLIMVLSSLSWT